MSATNDERQGLRALPPALLLAFAGWFVMIVASVVVLFAVKEPWSAVRYHLTSGGVGFATQVLGLVGVLELARRLTGSAALGMRIAAAGFAFEIVLDLAWALLQFKTNLWEHEWVYKVADYAFWGGWLALPVGVAIANWRERRMLAIIVVAVWLLTWPPALLAKPMYSWLPAGKSGEVIEAVLRALRYALVLGGFAVLARGHLASDRLAASSGLRIAAKALWLRLIAAAAVPLLTLLVIGGRASKGSVEMLKLATFVALLVNIFAFVQFGVGALRTARASVPELGRWPFVLGGAASLWASGVMISQTSWLYRLLYKDGGDSFGGGGMDYAQALALALPLVITGGMALIAVGIGTFAGRRGSEELRGHAQAKGAGFVTLSLVAIAMTSWMVPKATSLGSLAMLMLLALGSAVAAIVMMAKLLGLAADELDREAGLPTASVVNDGT